MLSTELCNVVFDNINDLVIIYDTNRRIVNVNSAIERVFGIRREEILGKSVFEFIDREHAKILIDREKMLREGNTLLQKPQVFRINYKGREIFLEAKSAPIIKDGEFKGIVSILRDVTERVKHEKELERMKEELENIFNNAPFGIAYFDKELRIIRLNAAAEKIVGMKTHEIRGRHCYDVVGQYKDSKDRKGRERICDWCKALDALKTGLPMVMEREYKGKWLKNITVPVKNEKGEIVGGMEILTDITKEKELLNRVKAAEEKYKSLFENARDGIFIVDENAKILEANRVAYERLGYKKEEFVGKSLFDVTPESIHPIIMHRLKDAFKRGYLFFESYNVKKDGSLLPVEIVIQRIEYEGKPALLNISRDISFRKEMEDKLMLAEKLSSLATLTAGIAHEINNPLNNILISAQLILEEIKDGKPPQPEDIEDIIRQVERVSEIVKSLKDFSKVEIARNQEVNLREIIESTLKYAEIFIKRNNIRVEKELEDIKLAGNKIHLQQVFYNIIVNACEAMEDGGTLEVRCWQDKATAKVLIKDEGVGISKELLRKIFDPFFTTKGPEGTGLGLSVALNIVKRMGGEIRVESEPGKGSTFTVVLPLS